jgi:hypothetical protein
LNILVGLGNIIEDSDIAWRKEKGERRRGEEHRQGEERTGNEGAKAERENNRGNKPA